MTSTDAPQGDSASTRPSGLAQALVALLCLASLVTPFLIASPEREGGSVGNELVFDGRQLITQHEVLSEVPEEPGRLLDTLTTTWWGRLFPEQQLYRPLSSFTLGLAGVASGERYDTENPGLAPLPYKLFAVALKIICALLVLQLATLLLGSQRSGLVAGLLFATLPVHGEAVFDVAGIAELLCAALSLGSWYAWIAAGDRPLRRPELLATSLGLLLLAVHAKESAYMLPLVFFLTDAGRASGGGLGAGLRHALGKLPALAAAGGVLLGALAIRFVMLGSLLPGDGAIDVVDNPLVDADPLTRAANALRVLASGVAIVFGFNPLSSNYRFSADYSLSQVEALGAFALPNLIGIAALLAIVAGAVVLFPRCRTRASLVLAYFASLLVVSNLFFPIGTVFAERLLFFPSALVVMFVAPFLARFGAAGLAIAGLAALGNGYWTHARASTWSSDADLWEYTARESATDSARAAYNQGIGYAQDQLSSLAEQSFLRALELAPSMDQARLQLAAVRLRGYDYDGALEPLRELVEGLAERDGWSYTPGDGDGDGASYASLLQRITTIDAKDPGLDPERNLAFLDSLLARGLERPEVHVYRFETLLSLDRDAEAEDALKRAMEVEPTPLAVDTYAEFLRRRGRPEEATALYDGWLAQLEASTAPGASAVVALKSAQLALGSDPQRAYDDADELLVEAESLPRAVRAEALILRAQARMDLVPAGDRLAEARAIRASVDDYSQAVSARATGNEKTYAAMYGLSTLLMTQGRFDAAEAILISALGYLPAPVLQYRLGKLQRLDGRVDEALETLEQAVAGLVDENGAPVPGYLSARLEQLRALAASSRPDAADRIDAILDEERLRGDWWGSSVWAVALIRFQRWSELDAALLSLQAASAPESESPIAVLQTYANASQALRQSPNDLDLLTQLASLSMTPIGVTRSEQLDPERGLATIVRAIELTSPTDVDRLAFRMSLRASILEAMGRLDEARAVIDEVLEMDGLPAAGRPVIESIRDRLSALTS